ncbi:MAG: glycosyltransferase [Actinomycetota bacterium]
MKLGIVIPVYHANGLHADFTRQTVESITSKDHNLKLYLIVNYSAKGLRPTTFSTKVPMGITVVDNPKGNHVGTAWNMGIKMALAEGMEYVIVANNDLIFHENCVDNLVDFAQRHLRFIMWTASQWDSLRTIKTILGSSFNDSFDEHPHFSCFMVNNRLIKKVGWFDENLSVAYMEDGDMHYRIILSGNKAGKTNRAKFYHYGSRTIKVDEDLYSKNVRTYEANRDYIRRKWNTDFHQKAYHPPEMILKEKGIYKTPFDKKEKGWNWMSW